MSANIEKAIAQAKDRLWEAEDYLEELRDEYASGNWTPGERAEWMDDLQDARNGVQIEKRRVKMLEKDASQ